MKNRFTKIEALKYISSNYTGYDGGYQFSCLVEIILEEKDLYLLEELDLLIKEMTEY